MGADQASAVRHPAPGRKRATRRPSHPAERCGHRAKGVSGGAGRLQPAGGGARRSALATAPPMSLLLAATLVGLAKALLLTLLAVLNATLALLASLATWKTYLALGTKVGLIALFCVPVVGVLAFLFWGQRVVRDRQK